VDAIHVLEPIRFTQIRRNEISETIPVKGASGSQKAMTDRKGNLGLNVAEVRQQRAALILRDVRYGIEAHIEVLSADDGPSPEAKHLEKEAGKKLAEQLKARAALAERKIAVAEAQAAAEVKAAAAELAAEAAERVLAARLSGAKTDPSVDAALGDLAKKLQ